MTSHDSHGYDPLDSVLGQAFAAVHDGAAGARPSLTDVHHRARRNQRRRTTAMVGAMAVVGAGAVALVAARANPADAPAADAPDDGAQYGTTTYPGSATTWACYEVLPTTTISLRAEGRFEPTVSTIGVEDPTSTIEVEDAVSTTGVGTTTTGDWPNSPDCGMPVQTGYHCWGEGIPGEDGSTYYDYCEPAWGMLPTGSTTPDFIRGETTVPWNPDWTSTTGVVYPTGTTTSTMAVVEVTSTTTGP